MVIPHWPKNLGPRKVTTCGWCAKPTTARNRVCADMQCRDAEKVHKVNQAMKEKAA